MSSPQMRDEMLFALALEKPADKRAAFLDATCEGDPALRQRLEALLAAHEQSNDLMATGASAAPNATIRLVIPPTEEPGAVIGRYKILEKVGEGGFGVVYVAEQKEPVKRRVALKIIKLGMDTRQVVARFEAERQALALMDHPNIAKVLDAGATENGRPFFVMELVRGIKITEYCDQNKLSTRERLDLFIKVCQAIQHAHQKGIIHRDIKPSNILVTLHDGVPVPKVIDFGIAKATQQDLTDKTLYTQLQQFIGTPAYMSPEQAEMSGLDIDTRSDIYSLGVLLYELLTGSTPFDANELMSQGIDAMRKAIREKEPPRPSTKLSQTLVAANVSSLKSSETKPTTEEEVRASSRRLLQIKETIALLRGDLDWIVMKCLEKDRTRRYETANGLAVDLKRHLNNEAVAARPPSATYRFQKMVRRNKLAFVAVTAVAIALLLGIAVSTWQAVRATHAKQEALAAQAQEAVQRKNAEANEQKAVAAQKAEAEVELAARQRAYASDMNVAMQALAGSNLGRAQDLLNRQRPLAGQKDLRGWEWRYLWRQTRSDALFTLCQKSEIESLAVSANGRWLAIGLAHKDGLFVYDLQTRQQVAHLAPGEGRVRAAFSPAESLLAFTSGYLLASENQQATLHLWNAATRQTVAEFPLDGYCAGLAFSKDGRTLVTSTDRGSGQGGQITVWKVSEGTRLASYSSEQFDLNPATSFAATSDLSVAAYGDRNGRIHVIDLHNGKELWKVTAAKEYITALAFSPDGKTLASAAGFDESSIRLWEAATGQETGKLEGHTSWVGSLVFWPDGKKLASASADQTLRTWDIAGQKCLDVMRGHRLEVWRLALLPDEKTLVSASKDGMVCLWDMSVTHPRQGKITWPDKMLAWQFAPDSQSILTLDRKGKVARWSGIDFQEKESLLDIATNLEVNNKVFYCFSRNGRFLATGSTNGNMFVWDLARRDLWREFKSGDGRVFPAAFLAGENRLIGWSRIDNRSFEWDLESNREIQSWAAPPTLEGGGLSPDERLMVEVGVEGDVSVRNLAGQSNTNLPLDAVEGWSVAFSSDGKRLAIASSLGYARVWDTATWREEATLRGFLNAVFSVAFSPGGQRLITGGSNPDDAVKLWDTDSWQELLTLEGTGSEFVEISFSPDGNSIGAMSGDGILQVWRAPSWAEIHAAEKAQAENSKAP